MTMIGIVQEVQECSLTVCDCDTCQQVVVNTSDACCFCPGDKVCIWYNGVMTTSIPPQITADCIQRIFLCRCRR